MFSIKLVPDSLDDAHNMRGKEDEARITDDALDDMTLNYAGPEEKNIAERRYPANGTNSELLREAENGQNDQEGELGLDRVSTAATMQRPAIFNSTIQEIGCVVVCTMSTVLGSLNSGGLSVALPSIGTDFDVSGGNLSWTISASSLSTGSLLLLAGAVADNFRRREVILVSYIFFAIVCLGAGFCKNYVGFIILRALQGIPAASSVTASVGILGTVYSPGRRKNYALATFSAGAPIGFVFGIIAGGICTQVLSWRATMYFFAMVYAVVVVLAWFSVPNIEDSMSFESSLLRVDSPGQEGADQLPAPPRPTRFSRLKGLDYLGAAIAFAGMVLFIFSLSSWESAPQEWKTPYIIVCLILGLLLIVAFCMYEAYVPKKPLMPMYIWKYKGFALCMGVITLGWMNFTGVLSYNATLYFQDVQGYSPIMTTAMLVPMAVSGILTNVFAGLFLHKIPGRILLIVAMVAFTLAAVLWSLCDVDTLYWKFAFPALIIQVIGADLAFNVCNAYALSAVDKSLQSTAGGVFQTILMLATTVGLALGTTVNNSVVPENPTLEETMHGYRASFYFGIGTSALGVVLAFFLKIGTQGGKQKK